MQPRGQVLLWSNYQTLPWLGDWQAGLYGEMEKNDRYDTLADTLNASSFYYHLLRGFFRSPAGTSHRLEATYSRREDFLPQGDGRLQGIEPAVDTHPGMMVAAVLAMHPDLADLFDQALVIGEHGPAIAEGPQGPPRSGLPTNSHWPEPELA